MKKLLCFIMVFMCCSCDAQPESKMPCWITGDYSEMITTQEAILKSYLYPMNLKDPVADAKLRINNGDYRLIGIGGIGISYPGIDLRHDGDILCKLGGRYLQGTSDAHESKSHSQLIQKFSEYAGKYNAVVIEYYKTL